MRRFVGSWGSKTLFQVRASDNEATGTILIYGNDRSELEKVKRVVQFAVFVANNLKLEAEHFFSCCGTLLRTADHPIQAESLGTLQINTPDASDRKISEDAELKPQQDAATDYEPGIILSASPHVKFPIQMEVNDMLSSQ